MTNEWNSGDDITFEKFTYLVEVILSEHNKDKNGLIYKCVIWDKQDYEAFINDELTWGANWGNIEYWRPVNFSF